MLQRFAAAFLLFFCASAAVAQDEPPPVDGPSHWEVHDENGPKNFDITVRLGFVDQFGFRYFLTQCRRAGTGELLASGILIEPPAGARGVCQSWSDDSELWSEWHWDGDNYDKVGGSPAVRSYHPAQ
jgi:hypothetical protein